MQDGMTVLLHALDGKASMKVVDVLLANGADITAKDEVPNFRTAVEV